MTRNEIVPRNTVRPSRFLLLAVFALTVVDFPSVTAFDASRGASLWTGPSSHARHHYRPFVVHRPFLSIGHRDEHSTGVVLLAYDGDENDINKEPFFEMRQIPTATTGSRLDHVVTCAENGGCNVEEMLEMIEELERLNAECEGTHSRECNLDAVAARNVLKVALASRLVVEEGIHVCDGMDMVGPGQAVDCNESIEDECDFDAMMEMHDECMTHQDMPHNIPTAAMQESKLERIVQCAEDGDCPVGEMTDMIEELERLNMECEGTINRECNLAAVEARNILKVALASQAAMARSVKGSANRKTP